jgi:hypothetical protein
MTSPAQNLIASFYSKPVTFFVSDSGERMVEVFDVHTFKHGDRNVIELAAEIMAYKRMMIRLRTKKAADRAA